jgi:prefoldin subunit 5
MSVPDPLETVRELATHASDIKHLQADMDKMVKSMQEMQDTLDAIRQTLDQAHGGWRMLIAVGSASALIGGAVAWFVEHFSK